MNDASLEIAVKGASHSKGELVKVGDGYRAIGGAAEQASHSVDKLHARHEKLRAKAVGKEFLGGRSGIGGAITKVGHLGAAGGAAFLGMEALNQFSEYSAKINEAAIRGLEFQREIVREIANIERERESSALSATRAMSANDRASEEYQNSALGKVLKQVEAFDKLKEEQEKATRATDAAGGLASDKAKYANPALTAVVEKLKPKQDELENLKYKADNESKLDESLKTLQAIITLHWADLTTATDKQKYANASGEFAEQSGRAIDTALASDNARKAQIDAAMAAAKAMESAAAKLSNSVDRMSASTPGH